MTNFRQSELSPEFDSSSENVSVKEFMNWVRDQRLTDGIVEPNSPGQNSGATVGKFWVELPQPDQFLGLLKVNKVVAVPSLSMAIFPQGHCVSSFIPPPAVRYPINY